MKKAQTMTGAEGHAEVMARLKAMSSAERVQTLIDAGILTKERLVAPEYATDPILSYRTPSAPR